MKVKTLYKVYVFTFPFIFFMGWKEIIIFLILSSTIYLSFIKNEYIVNKHALQTLILLLFYIFVAFVLSIVYIYSHFDYNLTFVINRFETQLIRFVLIMTEVYIGFKILSYLSEKKLIALLFYSLLVTIVLAIYQNIAYKYNLPMWGLFFSHNDKFAIDQVTGFRNNALLGEPKYLSVYMAVSLFMLYDLSTFYIKKIYAYILLALAVFIFLNTSSANGLIAFFILFLLNIYIKNKKIFFILLLGLPSLTYLFLNNYELFIFRPSHLLLLDALTSGSLNMSMMDDLVFLPYLAWLNYDFMLPFGFGLGLLHFYAANFIDEARWFNLSAGYIDSNVALISYISNFGLILVTLSVLYMLYSVHKNLIFFKELERQMLIKFSIYSFFVGLLIGGNLTVMMFFSIGLIIYYSQLRKKEFLNEN
jgi:hypothetical protein